MFKHYFVVEERYAESGITAVTYLYGTRKQNNKSLEYFKAKGHPFYMIGKSIMVVLHP